jgi:hypothetical protein
MRSKISAEDARRPDVLDGSFAGETADARTKELESTIVVQQRRIDRLERELAFIRSQQ